MCVKARATAHQPVETCSVGDSPDEDAAVGKIAGQHKEATLLGKSVRAISLQCSTQPLSSQPNCCVSQTPVHANVPCIESLKTLSVRCYAPAHG